MGRVAAVDEVEVRARVQGLLRGRLFTEGQLVKAGDVLFVIEPEPALSGGGGGRADRW